MRFLATSKCKKAIYSILCADLLRMWTEFETMKNTWPLGIDNPALLHRRGQVAVLRQGSLLNGWHGCSPDVDFLHIFRWEPTAVDVFLRLEDRGCLHCRSIFCTSDALIRAQSYRFSSSVIETTLCMLLCKTQSSRVLRNVPCLWPIPHLLCYFEVGLHFYVDDVHILGFLLSTQVRP
jgi:hypothetical protein